LRDQVRQNNEQEEQKLKLQARILALERIKASDHFENETYDELQNQYLILEGYYNELLEYVRTSHQQRTGD